MPPLFVSDLDGTLLDATGHLSDRSRAGILQLLDRGAALTVASARNVVSMRGALGPIPLTLPVICFNGGFVSDLLSGRHLHVFALASDVAAGLYATAQELGLQSMVSTTTSDGDRMYVPRVHNAGVGMYVADRVRHADPRLRLVDDPAIGLTETVTCLTTIAQRPALEPLLARVQALGDVVRPHLFDDQYTVGWAWITIHAGEATKARAIDLVRTDAGLQDRELVVFGDQHNDLPMFAIADHAVAPANAHPDVLDAADEIIGPHTEDSVVRWLLSA